MIYILIVLFSSNYKTAITAEFNNFESCKAAATEIQKQNSVRNERPAVILCAQKGLK